MKDANAILEIKVDSLVNILPCSSRWHLLISRLVELSRRNEIPRVPHLLEARALDR